MIWPLVFSSTIFGCLYLQRRQKLKREILQQNPSPSHVAYVQLFVPLPGREGMIISIHNDFILSQAIKDVDESTLLYILLENRDQHINESFIAKYVSEVYSRCWDELVFQNKIKVQCVVSSDSASFGFLDKDQLLNRPNLCRAYICDDKANSLNLQRIANNLSPLHIIQFQIPSYSEETIYSFDSNDSTTSLPKYEKVAVGGTFDQLHNGHRKLLTLSASICTSLTVGLLSDTLLTKKTLSTLIQGYSQRKHAVETFLHYLKPTLDVYCCELTDPFGPTITDPSYQAICVSSETISGALEINRRRRAKGYEKLDILVVKRSDISTLSSTYLRERRIS